MRVSRRALMAVARADAAAADHATVARLTGLCERTVQYARATLVHLGLCRVVATGRYLTAAERHTATATHAGPPGRPPPPYVSRTNTATAGRTRMSSTIERIPARRSRRR